MKNKDLKTDKITYKTSGVNIDSGNEFFQKIRPNIKLRPEVMSNIGGFNAACRIPESYKNPLLISTTDGVGSKLKFSIQFNDHRTIGIDLVAMCVNDLIVCGAEPLFFLDYFAVNQLDIPIAQEVIKGICEGCEQANCSLVGGETAEMPRIYQKGDYDLAGFCVGVVEKDRHINGNSISAGDTIIGIPSSGIHANGYALIHTLLEKHPANFDQLIGEKSLRNWLLEPTKIYVNEVLNLTQQMEVKGIAHITGGGLADNFSRILPSDIGAKIDSGSWTPPPIFEWIQQRGKIDQSEIWRVFNQGIGMVLVVSSDKQADALKELSVLGAVVIGEATVMKASDKKVDII